jgi:hypothetical protein
MNDIIHDLEEDRDPYYVKYGHGISGSDAETCRYDAEDYQECAERLGLQVGEVHHHER